MTQHKRPFSGSRSSGAGGGTTTNSNHSSGASCSTTPISPDCSNPMKKAKSQQVAACSLDQEKNGLQRRFDTDVPPRPAEEEDSMLVDQEELKTGTSSPVSITGVASNLSRKKATPPQPPTTKKLVIKSFKSMRLSSIYSLTALWIVFVWFLGLEFSLQPTIHLSAKKPIHRLILLKFSLLSLIPSQSVGGYWSFES